MKKLITKCISQGCYMNAFFLILALVSCTGKPTKPDKQEENRSEVQTDTVSLTDKKKYAIAEKNIQQPTEKHKQNVTTQSIKAKSENIDTDKIYEQAEVVEAIPPFSNSQIGKFYTENFKYPDMEPINGNGYIDLIVEKDGSISTVIVVKSIHPKLDKEFVRVAMLFPKFTPGKKNGIPVRSKLRMPTFSKAM